MSECHMLCDETDAEHSRNMTSVNETSVSVSDFIPKLLFQPKNLVAKILNVYFPVITVFGCL